MKNMKQTIKKITLAILLWTMVPQTIIYASTILQVGLNEVAQQAELIFEGRVIYSEPRLSTVNGYPFTYFTFEISDIIKGSYDGYEIELGFMGGPKDGSVLTISDMVMPKINEKGIYFVESISRRQVLPHIANLS